MISKEIILLCLLEFILWKRWMSGKMCSYNIFARWTVKTDKFTYVYCNFLVLFSTSVYVKQSVNKADENLSDFNFLSRYHYTKSKNYLKRRYRIRHWIPMFIGTPCIRLDFIFLSVPTYILFSCQPSISKYIFYQ